MDGVIVIDKPAGVTSHDVVAVARRSLRERRIGHTGTLDPLATGVLPLACGRATRLVRFLTSSDKDYLATIRFGLTTDTYDVTGTPLTSTDARPTPDAIEQAVTALRGEYLQAPPAYSAKKIGGTRAYALARRDQTVVLAPVPVSVTRAELIECTADEAVVAITCSAGFYVRAFAQEVGRMAGVGACLAALRRTRSGQFTIDNAVGLDRLQAEGAAPPGFVAIDDLLQDFPAVRVTPEVRQRIAHGREIDAQAAAAWSRVVDEEGHLVAVATPGSRPGLLHPSVVLI